MTDLSLTLDPSQKRRRKKEKKLNLPSRLQQAQKQECVLCDALFLPVPASKTRLELLFGNQRQKNHISARTDQHILARSFFHPFPASYPTT